jgi:hypothetical protein
MYHLVIVLEDKSEKNFTGYYLRFGSYVRFFLQKYRNYRRRRAQPSPRCEG